MIHKIKHQGLDTLVYTKIKAMILNNRLKPGQKITQTRLAKQLGVSRTPIRRAWGELAKEHLLEIIPRKGAYVREFSKEEIIAVFKIREVLEGLACREAAKKANREKIEYFRKMYQKAKESITDDNWEDYKKVDVDFHSFLIKSSGVKLLADIVQSFYVLSNSFRPGLIRPPKETFPEHMAIINALAERNSNAAEELARDHLRRTVIVLEASFPKKSTKLAGVSRRTI